MTSSVYGNSKILDESQQTNPINPYADTKKVIEDLLYWCDKRKLIRYVIFRYFNVCGYDNDYKVDINNFDKDHIIPILLHIIKKIIIQNLQYMEIHMKLQMVHVYVIIFM